MNPAISHLLFFTSLLSPAGRYHQNPPHARDKPSAAYGPMGAAFSLRRNRVQIALQFGARFQLVIRYRQVKASRKEH